MYCIDFMKDIFDNMMGKVVSFFGGYQCSKINIKKDESSNEMIYVKEHGLRKRNISKNSENVIIDKNILIVPCNKEKTD